MHKDGIATGVTLMFVTKGKSDVTELTVAVFGYSERVAEIIDRKTEIGWELPQVRAVLPYMATRVPGDCYTIRKDHPEEVDTVVAGIIDALSELGLPLLKSIESDNDIVRIMRDTPYSSFQKDMRKQLVAKYLEVCPDI